MYETLFINQETKIMSAEIYQATFEEFTQAVFAIK